MKMPQLQQFSPYPPSQQPAQQPVAYQPAPSAPGVGVVGQPVVVQVQPTTSLTLTTNLPARLGPYPVKCVCPYCMATVTTITNSSCICCMFLLFGCLCSCFMPVLKKQIHSCPVCKKVIGIYTPCGRPSM